MCTATARGWKNGGLLPLPLPVCRTLRTPWEVERDAMTARGPKSAFTPSKTKGSRDKRFCLPISPSVLKSLKKAESFGMRKEDDVLSSLPLFYS